MKKLTLLVMLISVIAQAQAQDLFGMKGSEVEAFAHGKSYDVFHVSSDYVGYSDGDLNVYAYLSKRDNKVWKIIKRFYASKELVNRMFVKATSFHLERKDKMNQKKSGSFKIPKVDGSGMHSEAYMTFILGNNTEVEYQAIHNPESHTFVETIYKYKNKKK